MLNGSVKSGEIDEIEAKVKTFIEHWKSDDENFKVSYRFLYNRFIIFIVDVSNIELTNTDIDTSVLFILSLQETYKVDLLDKMNVCFKQGEFVQYSFQYTYLRSVSILVFRLLNVSQPLILQSFWDRR